MNAVREVAEGELTMGWVDPRVGLGWVDPRVGLGWVEIFSLLVGWVGSWVRNIFSNSKTTDNSEPCTAYYGWKVKLLRN